MPFLLSIFVLMPIAYYPTFLRYHLPGTTDFNFLHFWWHTLTIGPWPSGPAWFLWVLLALDAIAALVWAIAPGAIEALGRLIFSLRDRPMTAFVVIHDFLDRDLSADAAGRSATAPGSSRAVIRFRSRPAVSCSISAISSSASASARVDLRGGLFAENGEVARRWPVWLGFALGVLRRDPAAGLCPPQLGGEFQFAAAGLARRLWPRLCAVQRGDDVSEPAIFLRFAEANWRLMDALRPSAYGIFLVHYIFIIWLQYAVYDLAWHAGVKAAIVFAGTLSLSWALTRLVAQDSVGGADDLSVADHHSIRVKRCDRG